MQPFIHTDTSEDENQDQVLLPISSIFPPNEIISKKYAPDVKPAFKLIRISEKRQKRRITLTNEAKNEYSEIFNDNDSLGYEYSSLFRKSLVYLKFNNKNFLKLSVKGKSWRYFGGIFIPLDTLLNQQVRKNKNVFKVLPGIDYIENKHSIQNSFGANCFSESPNLRFSSNYQSSNLFAAFKKGQNEYDLILQNDINSRGNTQWFNFTIEISEDKNYKFNIVNLTKSSSLYQKGMSVVYCSQTNKALNKIGWVRGCHSISYQKSNINREDNEDLYYYRLHFQYKSNFKNDVVTFCYCYPYSTIDMEKYFNKIVYKRIVYNFKMDKIKICDTLSGFPFYTYVISHKKIFSSKKSLALTDSSQNPCKSIIFIARQHPGESQSSFILEGVVDFLMEANEHEGYKKNYQFYIVPMVNIDGVFYGNYRTNLSGTDLNRVWRNPRKDFQGEVYYLKKFFFSLNKTSPISLIIDIHGHSNSLNSFFYGNPVKKQSLNQSFQNPKLFPFFCSKKIKQISFNQSTFSVSQDKKNCARVVLSEMFPKALVYTFQNSFYGWRKGRNVVEYTVESYRKLGRDLVQSYLQYARLYEKNPALKQKWMKQIQDYQEESKINEEVLTQSDDEAEKELVELVEMHTDIAIIENTNKEMEQQKKKTSISMGKKRFVNYRRHSPIKSRNYTHIHNNQTYITTDKTDIQPEPQGFLSIIKINTRSNSQSASMLENNTFSDSRKAKKGEKYHNVRDEIIQIFPEGFKQNLSENFIKVGKLITQKEMALQKLRQKKNKLEECLLANNKGNISGFLKSSNLLGVQKNF